MYFIHISTYGMGLLKSFPSFFFIYMKLSKKNNVHIKYCSVRLTWVRLCARPCPKARDTFLLVICEHLQRSKQMGVLAAVCTPTLKSANGEHQNSAPPYRSTVKGHSEGGKGNCVLCDVFGSGKQSFSSPLCVARELRPSN